MALVACNRTIGRRVQWGASNLLLLTIGNTVWVLVVVVCMVLDIVVCVVVMIVLVAVAMMIALALVFWAQSGSAVNAVVVGHN